MKDPVMQRDFDVVPDVFENHFELVFSDPMGLVVQDEVPVSVCTGDLQCGFIKAGAAPARIFFVLEHLVRIEGREIISLEAAGRSSIRQRLHPSTGSSTRLRGSRPWRKNFVLPSTTRPSFPTNTECPAHGEEHSTHTDKTPQTLRDAWSRLYEEGRRKSLSDCEAGFSGARFQAIASSNWCLRDASHRGD